MNFQLFLSAKDVVKPWRRAAIKYFIKGTGMGILVVEGGLFGMILGQFFKFFILFPACGFAIVLVLTNAQMELLSSFVQIVALITSLQIGYVVGLVARDFCFHINVRRTLASAVSTRPRQAAVRAVSAAKERHNFPDGARFDAGETD